MIHETNPIQTDNNLNKDSDRYYFAFSIFITLVSPAFQTYSDHANKTVYYVIT